MKKKEEKIIITIDEDGKIEAKTEGITGPICIEELENLLDGIAEVASITKTGDYYKKDSVKINTQKTIKIQNKK